MKKISLPVERSTSVDDGRKLIKKEMKKKTTTLNRKTTTVKNNKTNYLGVTSDCFETFKNVSF